MDPSELVGILRIGHETSMRGAGISLKDALARTRYSAVRRTFRAADLIPLIKADPAIARQWVLYSMDKRTSGGWYLTERGEIGKLRRDSNSMQFDSMEEAVAEYVVRELDYWARIRAAG